MAEPPAGRNHEARYLAEIRRRQGRPRHARYEELRAGALETARRRGRLDSLRLSEMERIAIYEYTTDSDFIGEFNRLQREEPDRALALHGGFIHTLTAALARLDPYVGTVKRGIEALPPETLAEWSAIGNIIAPRQFLSATAGDEIPEGYSDKIVLEIQSKTGKNIAGLSANEQEQEVLFRGDTRFRVDGRRRTLAGKWHIWLSELD